MSQIFRRLGFAGLLVLFVITPVLARDVEIAWDANPEPEVAGYIVRYGTTPGAYDVSIDVGNRTDWTISSLESLTTYYVAVEAYSAGGLRSDLSTEITIGPDYTMCTFRLGATSTSVSAAGGSVQTTLVTPDLCPWTTVSKADWITLESADSQTSSAGVTVSVAPNPTPAIRYGTVTIAGRSFTVVQAAATCELSVTGATSERFGRKGGVSSIGVVANMATCGWNISSDVPWLSWEGVAARKGSASFNYLAAPNLTSQPRIGRLSVAGRTISVLQTALARTQALDLDGNGTGDVLLYNETTGEWSGQLWNGASFVAGPTGTSMPGWTVLPADFNGDERSDLFLHNASTGAWVKAISQPGGSLTFIESGWEPGWSPTILDLNGDGRSDVFLYNSATGLWMQCITQASSDDFAYRSGLWARGWTVQRAVLNSDRYDDLFLYNANPQGVDGNGGLWFRVYTQPDGSFGYRQGNVRWAPAWSITVADFSGDGLSELFLIAEDGRWFIVSFTALAASYVDGQWGRGWSIDRADFNGDGRADLFLYNQMTGRWFSAVAQSVGSFAFTEGLWGPGWKVDVTDLDGNGLSDLVLYNRANGRWAGVITTTSGTFLYTYGEFGPDWFTLAGHVTLP